MTPRLATGTLVSALIRRVDRQGGSAMVLAKGDATAGGMLILAYDRGANPRLFERGVGPDGLPALIPSGPRDWGSDDEISAYWQRRRRSDPDLWVIELDIPDAERFTAETIGLS